MPTRFTHTNLIAKDWKKLSTFYRKVFGLVPVPPERHLAGDWLELATGVPEAQIEGIHLLFPGYGENGPTLEIFQYGSMPDHPQVKPNTPGFSHIAFSVEDVLSTAQSVIEHGGALLGELTVIQISGVGTLTFQYVTDPEGNIIEIQNWDRIPDLIDPCKSQED